MRSLILSFLLLYSLSSFAQKIRYTDTTNLWKITFDVMDDVPEPTVVSTVKYIGDTIVNDTIYFKQIEFNYVIWVREDTVTGKVFYRESFNEAEKILFDYNLSIGDTLLSLNGWSVNNNPDTFILYSIDSVLINNVTHVKQEFWQVSQWGGTPWPIIEGIGCLEGARMLVPTHVNPPVLVTCFINKGVYPTINPAPYFFNNTTSCLYSASVNTLNDKDKVSPVVIPQPANFTSAIVFGRTIDKGEVTITNVLGQKVCHVPLVYSDKLSLAEMNLAPGVYIFTVTDVVTKQKNVGKFVFE